MIHRQDKFRAQKSLAARVLANPKIEVRFNTELRRIEGDPCGQKVRSWSTTPPAGSTRRRSPPSSSSSGPTPRPPSWPGLGLHLDDGGYIVTNQRMETTVPGLYAVGDVRATPFRQLVVAAAEGARRRACRRPVHRRDARGSVLVSFRLIVHPRMEGRLDMAIDEALAEAVGEGQLGAGGPALRLLPATLSLGRFQRIRGTVLPRAPRGGRRDARPPPHRRARGSARRRAHLLRHPLEGADCGTMLGDARKRTVYEFIARLLLAGLANLGMRGLHQCARAGRPSQSRLLRLRAASSRSPPRTGASSSAARR